MCILIQLAIILDVIHNVGQGYLLVGLVIVVLAASFLGPLALVIVLGCPLRGVVVDVVAQIVVVGGVGAVPVYHRNLVEISHGHLVTDKQK